VIWIKAAFARRTYNQSVHSIPKSFISLQGAEKMQFLRRFVSVLLVIVCCGAAYGASYVVPPDEAMIARADAIVIARAMETHAEEVHGGVTTVTTFALEDVLKGDVSLREDLIVREPGGVLETKTGTKASFFSGAPRFTEGDHVLLFVKKIAGGEYAVADLELGLFRFGTDILGHKVVIRPLTEGRSWEVKGTTHRELRREADRFADYVRAIAKQRPVAKDYAIDPQPLIDERTASPMGRFHAIPLSFTITQYTLVGYMNPEGGQGSRWSTFPTAKNWNRGNSETNAGNGGSDAINAAFAQWATVSSVNYVLVSTNANSNGICVPDCGDVADNVNNIVFEKNLTAIGVPAFSCNSGGTVGIGGIQTVSGTNMLGGETFSSTLEADVSMNQGLGACIGTNPGITNDTFVSGLTHEVGHTLGMRHADFTRNDTAACTTVGTYDCASSAIMTAVVTTGVNGALRAWDQRAIVALYPPVSVPNPPTSVVDTVVSGTSVTINWTAPASGTAPARYHVYRCASNCGVSMNFVQVNGELTTGTSYGDTTTSNTAYLYKVRSVSSGGVESTDSNLDLVTTTVFTDSTITVQSTQVRAVHVTELRTAVTAVCVLAGNPSPCSTAYTDASLTVHVTAVKAAHLNELRSKLNAARSTLGLSALTYTDTPTVTVQTTKIKKAHVTELRNGVN
jgi:hypothetical protein